MGALLAVLFYKLLKKLEYELANPGADDDEAAHQARVGGTHDGVEESDLVLPPPNAISRKRAGTEVSLA